eukprot:5715530-Karenia_brevis.AAC.1
MGRDSASKRDQVTVAIINCEGKADPRAQSKKVMLSKKARAINKNLTLHISIARPNHPFHALHHRSGLKPGLGVWCERPGVEGHIGSFQGPPM